MSTADDNYTRRPENHKSTLCRADDSVGSGSLSIVLEVADLLIDAYAWLIERKESSEWDPVGTHLKRCDEMFGPMLSLMRGI